MSVTQQFVRKNATVDAVRVTREEISKIAKWCNGNVLATDGDGVAKLFIHLKPAKSKFRKTRSQAFIGDWIVKDSDGFKIYTDRAFDKLFNNPAEKLEKVG